ncbi:hypothetical protein PSACC_03495 [Paramicrosporidium saccamoebae]|uniref:Methionine--tRNA ligase n=1 Tax=Paramicrosporidium saccamoebae TaxID=1246581 RepID=A0A2H9TG67_9FUNG|nr:hypothetical protein PSACC_03495 [Paramicrosporidium saccamoebae]
MAAGLPLPTRLVVHGHWTMDGAKMSKSVGNVISPHDAVSEYGESTLRYYLLRNGRLDADGDFSREQIIKTVNGELVNQLGNLVSRAFNPKFLNHQTGSLGIPDPTLTEKVNSICAESAALFDEHNFSGGLERLQPVLHEANRIFSEEKPWDMVKLGQWQAVGELLGNVAYAVSAYCVMVQPVIPKTATQILDMIGVKNEHRYYPNWAQNTISTSKLQCSTEQLFPHYCDIFLTHDAPRVRKDHNAGWKHAVQVRAHFLAASQDRLQRTVGEIVKDYEARRELVPVPAPIMMRPPPGLIPPRPPGMGPPGGMGMMPPNGMGMGPPGGMGMMPPSGMGMMPPSGMGMMSPGQPGMMPPGGMGMMSPGQPGMMPMPQGMYPAPPMQPGMFPSDMPLGPRMMPPGMSAPPPHAPWAHPQNPHHRQ